MLNNPPFQSGAIRIPPREFLKRLPVRVSHLVFETESEDKNKPWMAFKKKLSDLSGPYKLSDKRNEPIYFFKMEHEHEFQCFNTNYYLEDFKMPSGAVWIVRFERHTHFVSFSFHRYFESTCTFITDGSAWDFLKTLNLGDDYINELLKSTVPGGNIDLAIVPKSFKSDELALALNLDVESHYVTRSQVFNGMAEVLMSFQVDEDQTEKPRPVMIRELKGMNARAAGEVIQILFEIEAYRAMASRQIFREVLLVMLDSLGNNEQYFVQVSEVCQKIICKKPKLILDLVTVEDYLPILTELTKITLNIDGETAQHARQYDTAQAYSNLVLDRLGDLREKPITQEPTIKTFLRHRLAQIDQTYKAIGQRQDCLSRQISQLDGLLRSRMEARQQYSVHCVHLMILILTILAILYYLPEVIGKLIKYFYSVNSPELPDTLWFSALAISFGILLVTVVGLYNIKRLIRKNIEKELNKAAKPSPNRSIGL